MRYLSRLKNNKIHIAIALVLFVGISARIAVASFGHNFDFKSYLNVINVIEKGRNVYATKVRYNYGPVWFNILFFLDSCTASFDNNQLAFAYAISLLLTLVDIGIFFVINKEIGFIPAVLFFLNPISISITGFHRQFDNLAILIGMLAVLYLGDNMEISFSRKKVWGLILLGFSLMTKHVLLAFPFWLAVKQRGWWQKLLVFFLPIAIFLFSFIPYWNTGKNGIIQKIIFYDPYPEFQVAPLWHWFVPNIIRYFTDPHIVFFVALAGSAFIFRTRNKLESLLIYTAILLITSPIITNQYCIVSEPVRQNGVRN